MSGWLQWDVHTVFAMLRPRPQSLITDNSVLLRHGQLTFFSHNTMTNKPRYFFLFDHAFLVTKQRKRNKFQLKIYVTLRPGMKLITDDRDNQFRLNASLKGRSYPIIMWANSRREKEAWVRDIMTAIGRLTDKSYSLEAQALSAQNRFQGDSEESGGAVAETPSPRERRRTIEDSPHSYLRGQDESPPVSLRSDYYDSPQSSRSDLEDSSSRSHRRSSKGESVRKRSVSAKSSSSSRRVQVEKKVERAIAAEQDLPPANRPKRSRKVWYDSDEEPHYYTDSDNESEDADGSGDDSGSSGSNSSYESERGRSISTDSARYPVKKDSGSFGRRASEADVSGPIKNKNKTQRRPSVPGESLAPPPKASSSKLSKKRSTSASAGNLPYLEDSPQAPQHKKEEKKDISDAFDLLSLNVPSPTPSYPPQHSQPHPHAQPHGHHHHPQGGAPLHSTHSGAHGHPALGVKVMDVGNLNSEDFGKLASRGFSASKPQPTHTTPSAHHPPTPTHTAGVGSSQAGASIHKDLLSLSASSPSPSSTNLDPQMYQQMMLQQQQRYLQQMQQLSGQSTSLSASQPLPSASYLSQPSPSGLSSLSSQPSLLGQPTSLSTSQPLHTSPLLGQASASLLGQASATLLGQPSSLPTAQPTGLSQLQLQQLQLQQMQQQQMQQAQLQQLGKQAPSATTPLAYSGATTLQGQQPTGVIYVDPLTYLQYQQQQQLLQLQQQQLLQQQHLQHQLQQQYPGAGAGTGLPGYYPAGSSIKK